MRITHAYTEVGVQVVPTPGVRVTHNYLEVAINPNETAPPPIVPQVARKPLVIIGGQMTQLSDSDRLDAEISEVNFSTATNGNALAITIGQPVYISGDGEIDLAVGSSMPESKTYGLVAVPSIASAVEGRIQTNGVLEATTGEWDAITGETGGLTPGACYYLDPTTAGRLTKTPPSLEGQYVALVGDAVGTTKIDIRLVTITAL